MSREISLVVNGRKRKLTVKDNWTLLRVIREQLRLKGTKEVCGIGECGACTVLRNGVPVSSCIELAVRADGTSIETIEGLAVDGKLHPLQAAFVENSAFQCGFCTAGMIMMAKPLVEGKTTTAKPSAELTDEQVRNYMSGNLCRCTGYQQIVDAIRQASTVIASKPKA